MLKIKRLISCLLFLYPISISPSSDSASNYVLELKKKNNSIQISAAKPDGTTSSALLPISANGYFLKSPCPKQWKIKREKGNKTTSISFKDENINFEGSVDTNANLISKKIDVKRDVTVMTDGNIENHGNIFSRNLTIHALNFRNNETILCFSNCLAHLKQSFFNNGNIKTYFGNLEINNLKGSFVNQKSSNINIGGTIKIDTKKFHNSAAGIHAAADILIETNSFVNNRSHLITTKKSFDKNCEAVITTESTDPAIIVSNKKISIICKTGINEVSFLMANDIAVTAEMFENKAHHIKDTICKSKVENGFLWNSHSYEPYNASHYTPSTIVAENAITFIINGKKHHFNKTIPFYDIPGIRNTGYIKAGQLIDISSDKIMSQLINGQQQSLTSLTKAEYGFPILPTVHLCDLSTQQSIDNPNHLNFALTDCINDSSVIKRPTHLVGYASAASKNLTGSERVFCSETLQKKDLKRIVMKYTGLPLIDGYKNSEEQFIGMQKLGFIHALIYGNLVELHPPQKKSTNFNPMNDERSELQLILNSFRKTQRNPPIDLDELIRRINLVMAGTHIINESELSYKNCNPYSVIYYIAALTDQIDEQFIFPAVYISRQDHNTNFHPEGLLTARDIKLKLSRMVNFGSVIALNKLDVKAAIVINQKPRSTEQEISDAAHRKKYTIITPQAGGNLVGIEVEIEAGSDPITDSIIGNPGIKNIGGTIFAQHKVYLITKQGNIENRSLIGTQIVKWGPNAFKRAFTSENSSLKKTFESGKIISEGSIHLDAEAGRVISEASKIIAQGAINIRGYLGILLKSITSNHTYNDSISLNGLSIENLYQEAIELTQSEVISDQSIIGLKSDKGKIHGKGSILSAKKNIDIQAGKGTLFEAISKETTDIKTRTGILGFNINHVQTLVTTENITQSIINSGESINFNSDTDNEFEAVILHANKTIHVRAKRHNIYRGKDKNDSINTEGYTLGITFFGSDVIQALSSESLKEAVWSLASEDPLLKSIVDLSHSQDVKGTIAESTKLCRQIYNNLKQYSQTSKKPSEAPKKSLSIWERLGLVDQDGNFKPSILVHLGTFEKNQKQTKSRQTTIDASLWDNQSGGNTLMEDATQIKANDAKIIVDGDLRMTSGQTKETTFSTKKGISVGTDGTSFWGGIDGTFEKHEHVTNHPGKLKAKDVNLNVKGNVNQEGFIIDADDILGEIGRSYVIRSVDNKEHSSENAFFFNLGPNTVSGSYSYRKKDKKTTKNPTGIKSREKLLLDVKDRIKLIGAYINAYKGTGDIKTQELIYENIIAPIEQTSITLTADYSTNDENDIPAFIDLAYQVKKEREVTHATVSNNVELNVHNDISTLNRDMNKIHLIINDDDGSDVRLAIPIVNINKLATLFKEYRNAETSDEKEDIELTIDQLFTTAIQNIESTESSPKDQQEQSHNKKNDLQKNKKTSRQKNLIPDKNLSTSRLREEAQPKTIMHSKAPNHNGDEQESLIIGIAQEDVPESLIYNLVSEDSLGSLQFKDYFEDLNTRYAYFRFTVDKLSTVDVAEHPKTLKQRLLGHFDSYIQKGKSYVIDFVEQYSDGLVEVYTGVDLDHPLLLPKSKLGEYGRELGRLTGLAHSTYEFSKAIFFFGSAVSEIGAAPTTGGTSIVAVPFTVAAGVACGAKGCYLVKNFIDVSKNNINSKPAKSNVQQQPEPQREIVLERVKSFEQARNKALEILGDLGLDSEPHIGHNGVGKDMIVGRRAANKKRIWRLDWDPKKGPHINVDDYRIGKGKKGIKIVIPFEGDVELVNSLYKHLNK